LPDEPATAKSELIAVRDVADQGISNEFRTRKPLTNPDTSQFRTVTSGSSCPVKERRAANVWAYDPEACAR